MKEDQRFSRQKLRDTSRPEKTVVVLGILVILVLTLYFVFPSSPKTPIDNSAVETADVVATPASPDPLSDGSQSQPPSTQNSSDTRPIAEDKRTEEKEKIGEVEPASPSQHSHQKRLAEALQDAGFNDSEIKSISAAIEISLKNPSPMGLNTAFVELENKLKLDDSRLQKLSYAVMKSFQPEGVEKQL